jgi:hypothetical protein
MGKERKVFRKKDKEQPQEPGTIEGPFVVDEFKWIEKLGASILVGNIKFTGTPEGLQDLLNVRQSQGYELVSTFPRMAGSVVLIWKRVSE